MDQQAEFDEEAVFTELERSLLPRTMLLSKGWPLSVGKVQRVRPGKEEAGGDVLEIMWKELFLCGREKRSIAMRNAFEDHCFVLNGTQADEARWWFGVASTNKLKRRELYDRDRVAKALMDHGFLLLSHDLQRAENSLDSLRSEAAHLHFLLKMYQGESDEHA